MVKLQDDDQLDCNYQQQARFHFSAAYSPSTDPNLHDVALFMLSHEIMAVQQFFKLLKTFFLCRRIQGRSATLIN